MVIDVRGLGNFQRGESSFVFDAAGRQLWPDAQTIQGVSSDLVLEGNLHTYITSEGEIARFQNVTRVKAERLRPTKFAPQSSLLTDVALSDSAAGAFRAAGKACRVVYLKG